MATEIKTTFQLKRGTAARWLEVNPILAQGEPGYEYDTHKLKIGDGIKTWTQLPYVGFQDVISVETLEDLNQLPGDANLLYKVSSEKALYQWNAAEMKYESLSSGGGTFDPSTITLINGGTATNG